MNSQSQTKKILTPQQTIVLQHLVDGMVVKEISILMKLGASTVRKHMQRAKMKLGAGTNDQAVARAVACGEVVVAMDFIASNQ